MAVAANAAVVSSAAVPTRPHRVRRVGVSMNFSLVDPRPRRGPFGPFDPLTDPSPAAPPAGAPLRLVGRPDVVLVTEGTYPHAHGGVSVWCDQLVQGLPDHAFRLVALTAFGYQRPVWDLPDHVEQLVTIGLWDRRPATPPRRSPGGPNGSANGSGHPVDSGRPLALDLARLLVAPGDDVTGFGAFVDRVAGCDGADVVAELGFGPLVAALDRELRRPGDRAEAVHGARASDLVQVAGMLEHLLRPLVIDPGPAPIYHASSNGLAALVCLVARRRHGARFLLTEHGIYLRERYLELRRLALARPAKALLVRFHRLVSALAYAEAEVVAPGSAWNQRWETRHGAPPARVRPIYNGIDPGAFAARAIEPDAPVVSWLGRIDPIKDLETLVEAFAVVHRQRPDARLRLYGRTPAGNEPYRARLDALVETLGLAGVVSFEGGVAESADAYTEAQVGVLSSISEGFPYSLIEAMACGLPAVATGVGGVAEAVADTGLVVPPRAPDRFGHAVLELLDDTPRRQKLGVMARDRVLEHFTLDGCLEAYRHLYAELRAGGPGAGRLPGGAGVGGRSRPPGIDAVSGLVPRAERDELTTALGGPDALVQTLDADDVAATLESVGVTDDVATARFGARDVFDLAERMWTYATMLRRSGRIFRGVEALPRPEPEAVSLTAGAWGRGTAAVLPAVVVAAAAQGGADQPALVAASVAGWGLAQAGGVLAYTAHHRAPKGTGLVALRRGLAGAVTLALLAALVVAGLRGAPSGVAFALPLIHLLGATTMVMAGRVRTLLALTTPVAALSATVVVHPDPGRAAMIGPAAVATVVATVAVVALVVHRPGPGRLRAFLSRRPPAAGRWRSLLARRRGGTQAGGLLERSDWWGAVPLAVAGWLTAAFALLAVGAVGHLPGFEDVGSRHWLLVAAPLWAMVAAGEWLLLSMRRALRSGLEVADGLGSFRDLGGRVAGRWLALGVGGLGVAVVAGAAGAVATSNLPWLTAAGAAAVFAAVAAALFAAMVLTATARIGWVLAAMTVAVAALAWVAAGSHNPLDLGDHTVSLVIAGLVAFGLGREARFVLLDPASHR